MYTFLIVATHSKQDRQNLDFGLQLFAYPKMYFNVQYTKVAILVSRTSKLGVKTSIEVWHL